jgi:hypothetical protein
MNALEAAIEAVDRRISLLEKEKAAAMAEAKFHKGAMESRYDTFKEEAQYLAGGFQKRIDELSAGRTALLRPGSFGETMELSRGNERKTALISPVLGGETVMAGDAPVFIISAGSEMARALSEAAEGDEVMGWKVEKRSKRPAP